MLRQIEKCCKENGISISALEKACGFGNATIRNWDKSMPRVDNLQKVADYFNVPIEYFLEERKG